MKINTESIVDRIKPLSDLNIFRMFKRKQVARKLIDGEYMSLEEAIERYIEFLSVEEIKRLYEQSN